MLYNPYGSGSKPENVFCLKADYVESSHANNTGMAKFINDCVYDTKTPMQLADSDCRTTINGFPIEVYMNGEYLGVYNFNHDRYSYKSYGYDYNKYPNILVYEINSNSNTSAGAFYRYGDNAESSANVSELEYYKRDFNLIYGNRTADSDSYSEIKTLVEWVSVAEQDLFREMISEHFNKEYLFRYFLTVLMIGAVDSLGKNMKIMTVDGQVWFPTFYDLDTVLGIDNSGYLTIEPDVEIESGSYNTSNSNLWSKVWNFFNAELKEEWAKMRQGSFTLDNLMNYIYGEQISKIPAKLYNDDAQVKYLEFGSLYTYCCHGSKDHQIRRWLRERIAYVDSMLGYFTSQEDQVTIRMNKTGNVSFDVTPYIPLYFSVKWSNATGGTQTFKLKRGETKTFNYTSTTSTDQEVIIYHAKYIKRLDNLSNLNPSSCILSNAVKLTNVEIHSSELYNINVTNNKFLRSINLENCTALGTVTATGSSLNLSNCKYLRYCNVYNTHLTEVQLNTSGGSLTEIYYPKSIQSINLVKQRLLELIGLPYGENGSEIPTSLYTISIQECPSITRLNTSSDTTIASSFASMVYVNNLTIRNSLDLASLKFDGFHRLQNVTIENMYNLEEVGFNNLLPVGETSTIKYIGMSNCPKLGTIELNCTSNDYEITFADDAILNFGGLFKLNSITSNCVLKGIKTIVVPINLESMFFTNEYGSGYSTIENIWVSSQCNVDTQATTPIVTHVDSTYRGIDFLGMNLKNIDLGALVNIPKAINFSLSPTTVNPHFNLNRDGETYRYLQPVGTLDLSNYTESLARFFDGVDLDKLEIICNNNLPQTDLSYCFYNSSFSTNESINKLLTKVSSITNLDYCFYKTTIDSVDILDEINMGDSSSMNYTFAECPNIKTLNNIVIPSKVTSVEGMFNKCPLTTITNMVVNVRGSISGLFKGCNKLTTINTLRIPNVTDVSNTFDGCTSLSSLSGFELPSSCTNVSNLFNGCYMLTDLAMDFGSNITAGDNWYPPNLERLYDTTISNDYITLTGCSTLKTINNLTLRVSVIPTSFFNGCTALKSIDHIDIGGTLTSVSALFKDMNLKYLNNITFSSSSIVDYSECFRGVKCINSSTIINFPTFKDNNISMYSTFHSCTGLTSIVSLDYSKIYNMTAMYWNSGITSINDIQFGANMCDLAFGQCVNLSSINNVRFPNATSMNRIFYRASITNTSLTVPDSCTNITEMFYGCTNLTDISGMIFGSGVTSATDWITNCPITTANNITMKNNNTKFTGTTTLVSCTNFKITSDVTELNNIFQNCSKLASFSFSDESNFSNLTGLEYAFDANSSLVTLDLSNVVCTSKLTTINGLCRTCSALTTLYLPSNLQDSSITSIIQIASNNRNLRTLYNLYLPDGFKWFGGYAFGWVGTVEPYHAMDVIGFRVPNTTNPAEVFAGVCKMFRTFSNVIWPKSTTNIAGMFQNMNNLTQDLEIPSHITDCSNAFKGCTGMTHIHSNWNNSYTNGITSTDCYAGCTGITHIDNENVITSEYVEGLDAIPEAWGGYGFSIDDTGIAVIEIPEGRLTFELSGVPSNLTTNPYPKISWGDGTSSTSERVHTYSSPGTYIIKVKHNSALIPAGYSLYGNYAPSDSNTAISIREACTNIIQVPINTKTAGDHFRQCTKLKTLNLDRAIINSKYLCYLCGELERVDLTNCVIESIAEGTEGWAWRNADKLTTINLAGSTIYDGNCFFYAATALTTILGLDTADFSHNASVYKMFYECSALVNIPPLRTFLAPGTKPRDLNKLYWNCRNATTIDISGVDFSETTNIRDMFSEDKSLTSIIGFNEANFNKVTNASWTFKNTPNLAIPIDLSNLNRDEPVYMENTFNNCGVTSLTGLTGIKLSAANHLGTFQNMDNMINLDISGIDTSRVINFGTAWTSYVYGGKNIETVDISNLNLLGCGAEGSLYDLCRSMPKLKSLVSKNAEVSNLVGLDTFLYDCPLLTDLDLESWDISNVTSQGNFARQSSKLTNFKSFKNINCNMNLSYYNQLTVESLVSIINALKPTTTETKTLTLGSTNKAKLSSAQIKIATDKGWTVV